MWQDGDGVNQEMRIEELHHSFACPPERTAAIVSHHVTWSNACSMSQRNVYQESNGQNQ